MLILWCDGCKNFKDTGSKSEWSEGCHHSYCFSDECRDDSRTFGPTTAQFWEEIGMTEEQIIQQALENLPPGWK